MTPSFPPRRSSDLADRRARRDLGPGQLIGIAGGETNGKRDVVSVEQDRGFVDEHMTCIEAVFSSHTPVSGHQTMLALDCPISVKEPRRYVFQQRMGLAIADKIGRASGRERGGQYV